MKARRPKDNVDFFKQMMTWSSGRVGAALIQMFVIDAVSKATDRVTSAGLEEVRKQFGKNSFVHPDAWYATAVEIKKQMDEFYSGK